MAYESKKTNCPKCFIEITHEKREPTFFCHHCGIEFWVNNKREVSLIEQQKLNSPSLVAGKGRDTLRFFNSFN